MIAVREALADHRTRRRERIERGARQTARRDAGDLRDRGAGECGRRRADQHERRSGALETCRGCARNVRQRADARNDRRGRDVLPGRGAIVQRDVSRHERHAERARRVAQTVDRGDERAHLFRHRRVAEVQAVREAGRRRADRGDVRDRFENRELGGAPGIDLAVARVAADAERDRQRRIRNRHEHARIGVAGRDRGTAAHDAVVPSIDRRARRHVAMSEHVAQQRGHRASANGVRDKRLVGVPRACRRRHDVRSRVAHAAGEKREIDIHDGDAAMPGDVASGIGDLADDRGARAARDARQRVHFIVDREQRRRERRRHDPAEALLRLADRDNGRRQIVLCGCDAVELDLRARSACRAQLGAAARKATRSEILEAGVDAVGAQRREHRVRRAHQHVLQERIGHLNGAFVRVGVVFVERQRREGRAAEAAAVRGLPDEHDIPARAALRRAGVNDVLFLHESERDDVHQHVVVERLVDEDVAAEVRHADRVAVRGDPVDDLLRDVAAVLVLQAAETQRIGDADHLRTHAQHVAHDPADARRRALERHDLRGMIVRLVRDHDAVRLTVPLAEAYDARVFADPEQHRWTVGRKFGEMLARRLVGAMLAPLRVERVQLRVARHAAEMFADAANLVGGEREAELATACDRVVEHGSHVTRTRFPARPPAAAGSAADSPPSSARAPACRRAARDRT